MLLLNRFERRILALPRLSGQRIICGDCNGGAPNPRVTELTDEGRCVGCGGRSFVPAAELALQIARAIVRTNRAALSAPSESIESIESVN